MPLRHPQVRIAASVLVAVLVGVLVVGVLTVLVRTNQVAETIREAQVESIQRGKEIQSLSETINGCVDPEGSCYKQGQRRTAGAVADINRVVILAAACSVGLSPDVTVVERQAAIQSCVLERLARNAAAHP